jgi:hypothetical protein
MTLFPANVDVRFVCHTFVHVKKLKKGCKSMQSGAFEVWIVSRQSHFESTIFLAIQCLLQCFKVIMIMKHANPK